jgi:hypothetical protein
MNNKKTFDLMIANLYNASKYMDDIAEEIAQTAEHENIPSLVNNTILELIEDVNKVKNYIEKSKMKRLKEELLQRTELYTKKDCMDKTGKNLIGEILVLNPKYLIKEFKNPQSRPISGRMEIMQAFLRESIRFAGHEVKRPENWGGYAVTPNRIEFWQGRESRLHDRFLYTLQSDQSWKIERLAP